MIKYAIKAVLNCDKALYNSYLDMYGSSLKNPCVHALEKLWNIGKETLSLMSL